ncbi:hypothetical protein IC617_08725 [Neiella sp. HB171785]|uniref:Uncharacterized protein n=1 Tax=Neiella litorisoli TaxID=2771431 RepID=A0A8J6QH71_9GAMM|nr:hypothetical protein [Neiella litorisoli]MBD1389510.1 hypothetical protein [Neiella litorisoli]
MTHLEPHLLLPSGQSLASVRAKAERLVELNHANAEYLEHGLCLSHGLEGVSNFGAGFDQMVLHTFGCSSSSFGLLKVNGNVAGYWLDSMQRRCACEYDSALAPIAESSVIADLVEILKLRHQKRKQQERCLQGLKTMLRLINIDGVKTKPEGLHLDDVVSPRQLCFDLRKLLAGPTDRSDFTMRYALASWINPLNTSRILMLNALTTAANDGSLNDTDWQNEDDRYFVAQKAEYNASFGAIRRNLNSERFNIICAITCCPAAYGPREYVGV